MRRIVSAALCAVLAAYGCYSGPAPFEAADSGADDATTDAAQEAAVCVRKLPACPSTPPSYAATIATIVANKCVGCHYAGSNVAREELSTYQGVKANSGTALDQVYGCIMPPSTSVQLSDDEKTTLLTWLVCGSPNN